MADRPSVSRLHKAAFPVPESTGQVGQRGMTLREYYTGIALRSFLPSQYHPDHLEAIAQTCVRVADAAVAALAETEKL